MLLEVLRPSSVMSATLRQCTVRGTATDLPGWPALSRVRQGVYQVGTHKITFSHATCFLLGNSPTRPTYFSILSFRSWVVQCPDIYFCHKTSTPRHDNHSIANHSNETQGEDNKQEICRKCIAVSSEFFYLFPGVNKPYSILDICRLPLH